ncbi:2-hydroxyacid dehydrogenase [Saliniramus sp.]|uniref:2-hydroxyacid dehydrogenase n=1 Tax=Saliniramus sp. TaxID=2986772 RepID=UPI002C184835|nr:2-hydroxyacid dehydrogenase [Saliniramus sp.]HMB11090.1 2-hydroxyacid dehydrogenase [Saliniramus sp.]
MTTNDDAGKTEILMPRPMAPRVIEQLDARFTLHRLWEVDDADAFIAQHASRIRGVATGGGASGRVDKALIDALPALEIVSSFGVGYDHVDAAYAGTKGVVVTNTPDVLTDEVADLAIGLLLATLRKLPQADRYLREGRWLEKPFPLSPTLRERKIGILGYGRIGKAIARRIDAFGVEVVYHGRREQADAPHRYYADLAAMARDVDTLIVITPGGAGTEKIVDSRILEALGPEGVLINVARGSVVDEAALIKALHDGTILSAGLDVFDKEPQVPQELIDMDHVVLLPHVGSASVHTRNAMAQLVVDNLLAWFDGKPPLTPVPETPSPR